MEQFVDISEFQLNIDWGAYKTWSNCVAMKATEGNGFTDPSFHDHWTGALAHGIDRIIIYGFARPDLGNDPVVEANWMHRVVGEIRPGDIIALDYEVEHPLATADWAYRWLVQQSQNYPGNQIIIYSADYYIRTRLQDIRLAQFPLWLARWTYDANSRPPCPPPWSSYEGLQYSDSAVNIPGIPGEVDADVFLGGDPVIDLSMPEIANYFEQAPGNAWRCRSNGLIVGNAVLDTYRDYGNNRLKGLYYLGLPVSNEYPVGTTKGNTQQDFELGRLVYDTDGSLGGRPGQAKGVYPQHVLPQVLPPNQANIDKATEQLNSIKTSANNALSLLGK